MYTHSTITLHVILKKEKTSEVKMIKNNSVGLLFVRSQTEQNICTRYEFKVMLSNIVGPHFFTVARKHLAN